MILDLQQLLLACGRKHSMNMALGQHQDQYWVKGALDSMKMEDRHLAGRTKSAGEPESVKDLSRPRVIDPPSRAIGMKRAEVLH
jgi:hypothetical protein